MSFNCAAAHRKTLRPQAVLRFQPQDRRSLLSGALGVDLTNRTMIWQHWSEANSRLTQRQLAKVGNLKGGLAVAKAQAAAPRRPSASRTAGVRDAAIIGVLQGEGAPIGNT